ncbi:ORF1 [Dactylorhiza cryptic virus 2]|nr:ORF1 [Dactylorhiza cryptic virus 2]
MDSQPPQQTLVEVDASTHRKRLPSPVATDTIAKKPPPRTNERSATDYLLEQHRTGLVNHQPYKKRRYVTLYGERLFTSLVTLYTNLFQVNWQSFSRSVEKIPLTGTPAASHPGLCATVYVSHWVLDIYYSIRQSLKKIDPIAFAEYFFAETVLNSDTYDHFLSMLNAALRPTHITFATADEIYIPILDMKQDFTKAPPLPWKGFHLNYTLFHLVHQTLTVRKLVKMTPLSSDPLGRPSWLFDWPASNQAFAWFPMEGNYSQEDVTIAYIIGAACTPKLGFADFDEWRYFQEGFNINTVDVPNYQRVVKRHWRGLAEYRLLQHESIPFPNAHETDDAKFKKLNIGPLCLHPKDGTLAQPSTEASEDETGEDYVPESPRVSTRSRSREPTSKFTRIRVVDYVYYGQVIIRSDDTSRFAAFKMFNNFVM